MFGYFTIVLSNSSTTGLMSANTQPLSWPAYFPGELVVKDSLPVFDRKTLNANQRPYV